MVRVALDFCAPGLWFNAAQLVTGIHYLKRLSIEV